MQKVYCFIRENPLNLVNQRSVYLELNSPWYEAHGIGKKDMKIKRQARLKSRLRQEVRLNGLGV